MEFKGPDSVEFFCRNCGATIRYLLADFVQGVPPSITCHLCGGTACTAATAKREAEDTRYTQSGLGVKTARYGPDNVIKIAFDDIIKAQFSPANIRAMADSAAFYTPYSPSEQRYILFHEAFGWDAHPWL